MALGLVTSIPALSSGHSPAIAAVANRVPSRRPAAESAQRPRVVGCNIFTACLAQLPRERLAEDRAGVYDKNTARRVHPHSLLPAHVTGSDVIVAGDLIA